MSGSQRGFTLVEMMIVILTLAIVAAVVVPEVATTSDDVKASVLFANLALLRKAIELYHLEHHDHYPGTIGGVTNWSNFVTHLLSKTDRNGNPGTRYGPYLITDIPRNPYNNLNTGAIGLPPAEGDITLGWYYNPPTGEIHPAWPSQAAVQTKQIEKSQGNVLGVSK